MSISPCSAHSNVALLYYGTSDSFGNQTRRSVCHDHFGHVLSFLDPKDLTRVEVLCRSLKLFIDNTNQWRKQYLSQLNSVSTDPVPYIRGCLSYKKTLQTFRSRIYDADAYRHYLGAETESIPMPSLKRFSEPDPCDLTKTVGEKYVWITSPSYFKISVDENFPFELNKFDDPNDEEAPRLIKKKIGLIDSFKRKIGFGSKLERVVLKVPNTINNLLVLFEHPKNGHPSTYEYIAESVSVQHGNKRIPQGQICMREDVIGRNLTFAQQQAAATKAEVVISQLGHRILFDFLRHAKTNIYPDGQYPWTFARTSTARVVQGTSFYSVCGGGGSSGLSVLDYGPPCIRVGLAVSLE